MALKTAIVLGGKLKRGLVLHLFNCLDTPVGTKSYLQHSYVELEEHISHVSFPEKIFPYLRIRSSSHSFIAKPLRTHCTSHVYSPQTNMGPCAGKRCQGWITPVLCARHGSPYETQVSVSIKYISGLLPEVVLKTGRTDIGR